MKSRLRLLIGALFGVAVSLYVLGLFPFTRRQPVNIIILTLDTTRADRLGCYGYQAAQTPHLDALANRGVLFERAIAPAPMTSPSHSSMFTGLWPPEHGITTNGQSSLDTSIPTAADLVRKHGYETTAFVSAFVLQKRFGLDRGFDLYDDDLSKASSAGDELHKYRDGRYSIEAAERWISKRQKTNSRSKPFFCWIHLYDPHEPYDAHADLFADRYQSSPYDAEIAYVDRLIGQLFKTLEKEKLDRNTCVIIVGDHGESLGQHGEMTHGYMLHDSTLRVPLIIADPREADVARRVDVPVSLVDLFPTLLDLAQAPLPKGTRAQSLRPAITGKPIESRLCYSQTDEPYLQAFWAPLRGLTNDHWRYVRTTKPELYDLVADPEELNNLADSEPDTVRELDAMLTIFEESLKKYEVNQVALSPQQRKVLESLGYTGGPTSARSKSGDPEQLPDIKDMIGHLNQLDRAFHLIEEKKFDEAATLLEPLARDVPNLMRARLNLGLCRLMQKNYPDAIHWLKATLELDPDSDRAHDMLGFAYLRTEQLDDAEEQFRHLLKLHPDSMTGNLFLGEVYQRKGDYPQAMRYYQNALKANPGSAAARSAIEVLGQAMSRP